MTGWVLLLGCLTVVITTVVHAARNTPRTTGKRPIIYAHLPAAWFIWSSISIGAVLLVTSEVFGLIGTGHPWTWLSSSAAGLAVIALALSTMHCTAMWRGILMDSALLGLAVVVCTGAGTLLVYPAAWPVNMYSVCLAFACKASCLALLYRAELLLFGDDRPRSWLYAVYVCLRVTSWTLTLIFALVDRPGLLPVATAVWLCSLIGLISLYGKSLPHRTIPLDRTAQACPDRWAYRLAALGFVAAFVAMGVHDVRPPLVLLLIGGLAVFVIVLRNLIADHEYRVLQREAANQEWFHRQLVQNSSDVLILMDPSTQRTTYVSPAAEHILDLPEHLIGKRLHEVIGTDELETGQRLANLKHSAASQRLEGVVRDRSLEAVLSRSEAHIVAAVRDVTDRHHLRKALHELAFSDPLTGLANRHQLIHSISKHVSQRYNDVAVLFIDLDRFKGVNDAAGHETGDQVLADVAVRLRRCVPEHALIARIGGDEFVLLLYRDRSRAAEVAAEVIREMAVPFTVNQRTYQLGASIGIALAPDRSVAANELLRQADVAMYAAKRQRAGVVTYSPDLTKAAIALVDRDAHVAKALRNRDFEIHLQPQVLLTTRSVVGVEALLRWRDSNGVVHAPQALLDFAQRAGELTYVTRWVLTEAIAAMRRADTSVQLSVNIAPQVLVDPALPHVLEELLDQGRFPASQLTLEVTEHEVLGTSARTHDALCAVHDIGVQVILDDFGCGYSSLAHLVDLPLDGYKIDRRFVAALARRDQARGVMRMLVQLAEEHHLNMIAQGVETARQHDMLHELGVRVVQGYYYGKPQAASACHPIVDLTAWEHRSGPSAIPTRRSVREQRGAWGP